MWLGARRIPKTSGIKPQAFTLKGTGAINSLFNSKGRWFIGRRVIFFGYFVQDLGLLMLVEFMRIKVYKRQHFGGPGKCEIYSGCLGISVFLYRRIVLFIYYCECTLFTYTQHLSADLMTHQVWSQNEDSPKCRSSSLRILTNTQDLLKHTANSVTGRRKVIAAYYFVCCAGRTFTEHHHVMQCKRSWFWHGHLWYIAWSYQ